MNSAQVYTCSFTGHRVIKPEHLKTVEDRLRRAVEYAYSRGCRVFYCGGALGFDTIAAREVLRFRVLHSDAVLRLILPCPAQDELWNEKQRDAYSYILKNAECVEYAADEYDRSCMRKRNARLAELGDIVVAYLYKDASGAAQTVRIAKRLGKPVYNISPSLEVHSAPNNSDDADLLI